MKLDVVFDCTTIFFLGCCCCCCCREYNLFRPARLHARIRLDIQIDSFCYTLCVWLPLLMMLLIAVHCVPIQCVSFSIYRLNFQTNGIILDINIIHFISWTEKKAEIIWKCFLFLLVRIRNWLKIYEHKHNCRMAHCNPNHTFYTIVCVCNTHCVYRKLHGIGQCIVYNVYTATDIIRTQR